MPYFTLKITTYLREGRIIQRLHYLGAIIMLGTLVWRFDKVEVEVEEIKGVICGVQVESLSSGYFL